MELCSIIKKDHDFKIDEKKYLNNLSLHNTKIDKITSASNDLKSNKENNTSKVESHPNIIFNEDNYKDIRLENIPKEELKKYGFFIYEGDPIPESSDIQDWKQEIKTECEEEEDEEDGKLVIDEDNPGSLLTSFDYPSPTLVVVRHNYPFLRYGCAAKDCNLRFSDLASKENHEKKHCPICLVYIDNETILANHTKLHCDFRGCLDIMRDDAEREKHRKIHDHPVKPFQCNFCKRRFHYYGFTVKHRKSCKISQKLYSCKLCKINFSRVNQYKKHLAKHANSISCIDCNKVYVNYNIYNRHLYKYHNKHVIYQCIKCPRRYQYQDNLIRHLQTHKMTIFDYDMSNFIKIESIKK